MELRYWLADTLSGTIGPEVKIQGEPRFTSRFGGGDFTADIMLGHLRTLDGGLDAAAIHEVLSWTVGGKHSLVVTAGTSYSGEWLIWRSDSVDRDGLARVSGFELDGYPAFRSLNDDYRFTDTDQLTMGARLLRDAFYSYQPFEITVPWATSPSGTTRTVDFRSHTAYYDEALEEISAPVDGFQWRVVPTVQWSNHRPVKVERRVEFGEPEIRRQANIYLRTGVEGSRDGNLLSFPRTATDFSKYAQSVYGWGRGEGAKQSWVGLSNPNLTNQGHLIVTKNVTFSNATTDRSLTALTRAALAESQLLREPSRASVLASKVPRIPSVGDVVSVRVGSSVAWPNGHSGEMQVGQVEMRPNGNHLETFDLLAV